MNKPPERKSPGLGAGNHRPGRELLDPSFHKESALMAKISWRPRGRNVQAQDLPLLEALERRRWDDAPHTARWVRRRCGISSPSVARLLAELANLGGDR